VLGKLGSKVLGGAASKAENDDSEFQRHRLATDEEVVLVAKT